MDADGSERYRRSAKIHSNRTSRPTRRIGGAVAAGRFTLEIVQEQKPRRPQAFCDLTGRVIYAGHAGWAHWSKRTNLANDASPFEVARMIRDGRASFTMPNAERWLLT